ncbi:hypothetical protein DLREEDagrD3_28610 [Denitratisoma sp. agr-D3]
MKMRNWKRVRPHSLLNAMQLCVDFARERHNRSIERIADLMGVQSHTLYKWLGTGRMPANLIRPFENACCCNYVTWWLAHGAHKLLIDIPLGRKATEMDVAQLQESISEATTTLIRFYSSNASIDDTIAQLTVALEGLAWHRENVSRQATPELDLFGDDNA